MSLSITPTTEQIEASRAWIRSFYECLDSSDPAVGWVERFFQENAFFNFGNIPSIKGPKDIAEKIEHGHAPFSKVKNVTSDVDVFADRIYVQAENSGFIKNDPKQQEIRIKSVAVFWKKVNEEKCSGIDIYADPTPFLEAIKNHSK